MIADCDDDDLRREAIDERRARRLATQCQCDYEFGFCPGPANCPYADFGAEEP